CYGYADHRDLHSSLHDALPISQAVVLALAEQPVAERALLQREAVREQVARVDHAAGHEVEQARDRARPVRLPHAERERLAHGGADRKSTRLNSSHVKISYAVFC